MGRFEEGFVSFKKKKFNHTKGTVDLYRESQIQSYIIINVSTVDYYFLVLPLWLNKIY